jgi:hypothetical protein
MTKTATMVALILLTRTASGDVLDASPSGFVGGTSREQGSTIAAAQVIFANEHGDALLDWLAVELPKHIPFVVSRTEWKGFTTTIRQLRIETKPVALTIQLDEDKDYVPDEIAELAEDLKSVLASQAQAKLAKARSRIDVMSATQNTPIISGREIVVTASTDLDPRAADVDKVLTALSELTGGFIVDLVNGGVRTPGSWKWLSRLNGRTDR